MKPPGDLDRAGQALWADTLAELEADGISPNAETLARYVRTVRMAADLRSKADTLVVPGSMGQDVLHPALKMARDLELDAHKYAEALILTPQARKRAGLLHADEGPDLSDLGLS